MWKWERVHALSIQAFLVYGKNQNLQKGLISPVVPLKNIYCLPGAFHQPDVTILQTRLRELRLRVICHTGAYQAILHAFSQVQHRDHGQIVIGLLRSPGCQHPDMALGSPEQIRGTATENHLSTRKNRHITTGLADIFHDVGR